MIDPTEAALAALDELQADIDRKYPKPTSTPSFDRFMRRVEAYIRHEQTKREVPVKGGQE